MELLKGLKRAWLLLDAERRARLVMIFTATFAGYYLLGFLGLRLLSAEDGVAVFWPASGLAAGLAVILSRPAHLPIGLAVFSATVLANITARSDIWATFTFAACNTVECIVFARLFFYLDRSRMPLQSFRSVVAFLVSVVAATSLAALPAAIALQHMANQALPIAHLWHKWMRVDAIGIVSLAPMIILLPASIRRRPELPAILEGTLAVLVAAIAATAVIKGIPAPFINTTPAAVMLPIYIWIAARTPPVFSALGLFAVSLAVVMAALHEANLANDSPANLELRLERVQIAALTSGLALLTLASIFARERNVLAKLQLTEQSLTVALDAANMYAFDYDVRRNIVYRTGRFIADLGLPPVGSIRAYAQAMHPGDRKSFARDRQRIKPGQGFTSRYRLRTAMGTMVTVEHTAQGVFDKQGRLSRIVGICLDVTERENARAAMLERERQLRAALEAGRVFTFEYDAVNHRAKRSDNAASILGVPLEQIHNPAPFLQAWQQTSSHFAVDAASQSERNGTAYKRSVIRFRRPDGSDLWLEIDATAEYALDGKLLFHRGLMRDVTETYLANQRRDQVIDELDHRVKNDLNRMLALIMLSREGHSDLDGFIRGLERRIRSMAKTQERLSSSKWSGISVSTLTADELEPFRMPQNCRIGGPEVILEPKAAQALSLTVHELATNASKYGALRDAAGFIDVEWSLTDASGPGRSLTFDWRETCSARIATPAAESYGMVTIRNLLEWEVPGAKVSVEFAELGLRCRMEIPLVPRPRSTPERSETEARVKSPTRSLMT